MILIKPTFIMFKNFFLYTRSEQRGILVLLILILVLLTVRIVAPVVLKAECESNSEAFIALIESLNDSLSNDHTDTIFYFNPNKVTSEELDKLGFSDFQQRSLLGYRKAGGLFRKAEDVAKIYGVDAVLMQRIRDFMVFDIPAIKSSESGSNAIASDLPIELNSATADDLQRLRGIGVVFSQRIVKYRKLLGGYYNVDQLREVYGMSDELFDAIKQYVTIDSTHLRKINLDITEDWQLSYHPYADKEDAILILREYRDFKDKHDLIAFHKNLEAIGLQKIIPYLK